jgi:hypothetical protein
MRRNGHGRAALRVPIVTPDAVELWIGESEAGSREG